MILSPFVNYVLFNCSKEQTNYLAFILFLLLFTELVNNPIVSRFFLALEAYIIGFKINFYKEKIKNSKRIIWVLLILSLLIDLGTILLSRFMGIDFSHSAHFTQYVIAVVSATFIFSLFAVTRPYYSTIINVLAKGSFAVYLITANPNFQNYFWNSIIKANKFENSVALPLIEVIITAIIYIIFSLFDVSVSYILNYITTKINQKRTKN